MADNDYLSMLKRQRLVSPDFTPVVPDTTSNDTPKLDPDNPLGVSLIRRDNTRVSNVVEPSLEEQYIRQVQHPPLESDYHPSFWRKLAAGPMTYGEGSKATQDFVNAPYIQKLRDFQARLGGLKSASDEQNELVLNRIKILEGTQHAAAEKARAAQELATADLRARQATPEYNLQVHGYQPQSLDELLQKENAQHGFSRYQGFSNGLVLDKMKGTYMSGDEFQRQMKDKEAKTAIERSKVGVESSRVSAYNERTKIIKDKNNQSKFPTPKHQQHARELAIDRVLAEHPEWQKFAGGTVSRKSGDVTQKRSLETNPPHETSSWFGLYKTPPNEKDIKEYKKFTKAIQDEAERIMPGASKESNDKEPDDDIDIEEVPE